MSSAFSLDLICHQEKNPIIYLRCVQLCTQHLIIHLSRIRTNWETSLTMECSFIQLILSISLSFDRSVISYIQILLKHIKSYFSPKLYM